MAEALKKLTPRQQQILTLLAQSFATYQKMPTLHELMAATGIRSTNGIVPHLSALAKKGYIRWTSKSRGAHPDQVKSIARGIEIVGLEERIRPVVEQHLKEMLGHG